MVERDVAEKMEKQQTQKLAELEEDFHRKEIEASRDLQRKLDEAEKKVQIRFQEMSAKFNSDIEANKQRWESQHTAAIAALNREWQGKWIEREQGILEKEAKKEAERKDTVAKMQVKYEKMTKEALERVRAELQAREREDVKALEDKLKLISAEREELYASKQRYEKEVQAKYEAMTKRERMMHEQVRQFDWCSDSLDVPSVIELMPTHALPQVIRDMEVSKDRDLEALKAGMAEERDAHAKARKMAEEAHAREVNNLKDAFEREQQQGRLAVQEFEDELQQKYDILVDNVQRRADAEHEQRLKRVVEDLESKAKLDQIKTKALADAHRDAEKAVNKRFQTLVGELRDGWKKEEMSRLEQQETRIRTHYDTVLGRECRSDS